MASTQVLTCERCGATMPDLSQSLTFDHVQRPAGLPGKLQTESGKIEFCSPCYESFVEWLYQSTAPESKGEAQ